jgi:ubiquinone/menaquinone biosynthesis C-methylase UbiE
MLKVGTTNALNRAAWIKKTLKKIPEGLTLLDTGAGDGPYRSDCSHLKYITQDFGKYTGQGDVGIQMGDWDNSKLDIVSDILNIPLPDNSVDAIMCTEVFEHIPDPIRAITEFRRLLKPGGYLIITAPFCSLTHFAPYHFYTGFNRFFYEKFLPENDFALLELEYNGNYFEFIAQEIRRVGTVAGQYAGTKPGLPDRILLRGVLWVLQRLSNKGNKSSELLNFGMHVFAQKKMGIPETH